LPPLQSRIVMLAINAVPACGIKPTCHPTQRLAGGAVEIGPVSGTNSLLTGSFTGNFIRSSRFIRQRLRIVART
jgi:hypothetical protein